jgi:hypothetical protein
MGRKEKRASESMDMIGGLPSTFPGWANSIEASSHNCFEGA